MGHDPLIGQTLIATAMFFIQQLLNHIEESPGIENLDASILGGYFKRTNLLYIRSTIHMAMGNRKKVIKDLTAALKIDESFTTARESRACLLAALELKNSRTIHTEFKRIIDEVHRDNQCTDNAYGWLAVTTLNDPSLGSFEDARVYYTKCQQAVARRDELYGQRSPDRLPPILHIAHTRFELQHSSDDNRRNRYDILEGMRNVNVDKWEVRKNKHLCVNCGVSRKPDGGILSKCSTCKSVSYCSRECQAAVSFDMNKNKFGVRCAVNNSCLFLHF